MRQQCEKCGHRQHQNAVDETIGAIRESIRCLFEDCNFDIDGVEIEQIGHQLHITTSDGEFITKIEIKVQELS